MATQRRIKVNESNKVTIVTFNDSKIIDEAEIQEFGQELYDLVEREGRKKIILNFGNVEFLSSAALGKLIGFDKRVQAAWRRADLIEYPSGDLRSLRHYEIDEAIHHQGRRGRCPSSDLVRASTTIAGSTVDFQLSFGPHSEI